MHYKTLTVLAARTERAQSATRSSMTWACILFLFLFAGVIASAAQSTSFTTLASFNGTDGALPYAPLVQGRDGNFYGTTSSGGANSYYICSDGCGTIFKLSSAGILTILHNFCSQPNCADGAIPSAGLVQGNDGNFYGTTWGDLPDLGTIFKISPAGTLTTLYHFCSQPNCTDGDDPTAGLVQGRDGNFYGTTSSGGTYPGVGTVFKITPTGTLTTLYSFCSQPNCADGIYPYAGLVQGSDGNFYGTTDGSGGGPGTIFRITPSGMLTTIYTFCSQPNCTDGEILLAGLVQGSDRNFYGTTYGGGANGFGTIFKMTPSGTLTTLHSFDGTEGSSPLAGLVQGRDGNFYGTTQFGGNPGCEGYGCGTAFTITPQGALAVLYRFCTQPSCTDGEEPQAGLVQARDGFLYGTTPSGGAFSEGTVFRLGVVGRCAACRP